MALATQETTDGQYCSPPLAQGAGRVEGDGPIFNDSSSRFLNS